MRRSFTAWLLIQSTALIAGAATGAHRVHPAAAPELIVVNTPAIHISLSGEPVFRKIRGMTFSRLSNTAAKIFRDDTSGMLYLELKQFWMSTRSLSAPWSPEPNPPIAISQVDGRGDKDNGAEVDRELAEIRSTPAPHVVVSLSPSILIQVAGDPQFAPVGETDLEYVLNANGDVFKFVPTGAFYALAGRNWYYAPSLWGPWSHIPAIDIPANFAHIPPDRRRDTCWHAFPKPHTEIPSVNEAAWTRTIAFFEALKGAVVLLAGCGLLSLLHRDVSGAAETLLDRMHMHPNQRLFGVIVEAASKLTDARLWMLAAAAVSYSCVRFVEAYGLWKQRNWAQWFALLSGVLYLPWEILAWIQRPSPLHAAIIAINGLIVAYFAFAISRSARGVRH
jgi:uncharacterized membrane protein (DUF2068 family)